MRSIQLVIFLFFISTTLSAQHLKKTGIVIIGNIHDSLPNYHPQILFNILDDVKPDIILHEVDAAMAKDYFANPSVKGNEIVASNRYVKKYPGTKRLPFDFEGRNDYRKEKGMVPADNLSVKLIDSLYKQDLLTKEEKDIYEQYKEVTATLMRLAEKSPENFNNPVTDSICKRRQDIQHHGLLKIINNRPEFATHTFSKPDGTPITYREGYRLWAGFWDTRNQAMAKHIFQYARQYQGKNMVVLTGFLHRYYLIKALNQLSDGSFVLREFYQH
ncbi:hypothetical protein [Chitinophaga japonensis]|uniref:TraB family protein n=1 Tax=Chitinophaga japonensis TaxID=104662 RepID=A0A562TD89_CHIJA|nr:hypothetical protein [Chitinophaga japonensis]TWI91472.1 hypothetical protein LX66_0841 [Chitinophaga japonensis]